MIMIIITFLINVDHHGHHLHRKICCFDFKLDFGNSLPVSSSPSLAMIVVKMMMMVNKLMRMMRIPR